MAEDLYQQWLGVATDGRQTNATPNAYDLLGLPRFCHHKSAAEEAARRQMEKLDKYSIIPDAQKRDFASRMMNEVAQARLIVTEEKRYSQYDPKLAQQLGTTVPAEEVPAPPDLIPISEGGTRLDMGDAASTPIDQGDVQRLDSSLIAADAPEIRAEADLTAPREKGVGDVIPIPVLVGGIVVLVVLVVVVVMLLGSDNKTATPTAGGSAPPALTPGARTVVDPKDLPPAEPVEAGPDTLDEYDRPLLGRDRYEMQASDNASANIENEQLVLKVTDGEEGQVRMKFTPDASDDRRIDKMSCVVTLEGEQSQLSIAISTGGLRVLLTRTGQLIRVESQPGLPAGDTWLEMDASTKGLLIEVERQESKVLWYVNKELACTGPQIPPRGTPNVMMTLSAYTGAKATIDDLTIYRQPEGEDLGF